MGSFIGWPSGTMTGLPPGAWANFGLPQPSTAGQPRRWAPATYPGTGQQPAAAASPATGTAGVISAANTAANLQNGGLTPQQALSVLQAAQPTPQGGPSPQAAQALMSQLLGQVIGGVGVNPNVIPQTAATTQGAPLNPQQASSILQAAQPTAQGGPSQPAAQALMSQLLGQTLGGVGLGQNLVSKITGGLK